MSYKPDYDKLTKDYNDTLNILSGGKYTPLRRKSDVTQTSTFDKSLNSGYNNSVGANHDSPVYGNAQATKTYRPSYGNSQAMPSLSKGGGTTERGGRIPLDSTYGGIQNAKTYTPSYGNKTNGTMRASSPTTSVWRKDFETPAPTAPQTPAYRPGEGFITKPENAILRADERENIKPTQLPYKPDEHSVTYEQYSNHPTGFGELKFASNDVSAEQGEKTKWTAKFMDWIQNIFKEQQKATMINYQLTDNAQKNIQRNVWSFGAQHFLREQKGYLTSAWMLEHSLQDNPEDIYRGNDSRIAYLINHDNVYLSKLDEAIRNSKNGVIDTDLKDIRFSNGDLYYSIHKADIHVKGYKQENGKWIIKATMSDIYNFDTIQTFMDDGGGWSTQAGLGTVANDVALGSQILGAINPYNVTVEFYTTR